MYKMLQKCPLPHIGTTEGTYIPSAYTIQHETDACFRKNSNRGKCICDRRNRRRRSYESLNFDTRPRHATRKNSGNSIRFFNCILKFLRTNRNIGCEIAFIFHASASCFTRRALLSLVFLNRRAFMKKKKCHSWYISKIYPNIITFFMLLRKRVFYTSSVLEFSLY